MASFSAAKPAQSQRIERRSVCLGSDASVSMPPTSERSIRTTSNMHADSSSCPPPSRRLSPHQQRHRLGNADIVRQPSELPMHHLVIPANLLKQHRFAFDRRIHHRILPL